MSTTNLTTQDHEQWLANPLTKALKQSHKNQSERDTALLRQAVEVMEVRMFGAFEQTIDALKERLE